MNILTWLKKEISFLFHKSEWEEISNVYVGSCLFPEPPADKKYKITYKNRLSGDIRWEYRVG